MQHTDLPFEHLLRRLDEATFIRDISAKLIPGADTISVKTLSGSLRALTIAALWRKNPKRIFILAESKEEAIEWLYDLNALVGEQFTALIAEPDKKLHYSSEQLDEKIIAVIDSLAMLENNPMT